MGDLIELHRHRGNIKGRLTRADNFIVNNPNASKNQLIARLENLPLVFSEFLSIQDKIDAKVKPEQLADKEKERCDFEENYFQVQAKYKDKIEMKQEAPVPNGSIPVATSERSRLPAINLPKFDGKVSQWFSFSDTFSSLIHNDNSIDPIRKFHYLKSCLTDRASDSIESIPVTSENYAIAWETLTGRYNNKKVIVNYHLDKIFGMKALAKENFTEFRTLIDNIKKHIRALKALGVPTDHWDVILIYIINTKLDPESKRLWDMTLKTNELPKFEEFEQFLESRCFTLSNSSEIKPRDHTNSNKNKGVSSFITTDSKKQTTCAICAKSQHPAFKCPDLLSLSPQDRFKLVKRKELCLKCFRKGHSLNNCKFYNCKTCCQPHNVLLHFGLESEKESEVPDKKVVNPTIATHTKEINSHVLLETVMIKILSANGEYEIGRALIDPGSTSSFISRAMADKLCLKKTKSNFEINGIGSVKTNSLFKVACSISSLRDKYSHQIECLILNKITDPLPHTSFDISNWHFLNSYNLADPSFNCPGKIDILLGAKHCNEYSLNETYIPGQGLPLLRNTVFGWVVSGSIDSKYLNNKIKRVYSNLSTIELSEQLRKFWEIENITTSSEPIDNICEKLFTDSLTRLSNGKFQVKLPFDTANDSRKLGFSHYTAQKRLIQMERRRLLNSEFNTLYINFMKEYETLGHMERVPVDELTLPINRSFYLPHHAVLKTSSQTTKLRVVFDGSAKSSSGQSLNDLLLCGPTLQDDIFTHLCRLRFYPIVLLADVEKMYRQVFIDPEHRNFLKILWRDSPDEPIVEYRLTTVTYGTKPASFLAITLRTHCYIKYCRATLLQYRKA